MFEEDVDMEVDNERKASANIDNSQPTTPIEPETVHTNAIESPIPVHPVDNEPNKPVILSDVEMSNNLIEASEEESSLQATESDKMEAIKEKSDAISEPKSIDQIAPTHVEEADTKSKDETGTGNEDASVAADEKPETPKVESFAAVMHPTADAGSRFYIKRRIIVGNVSKFMNPGNKKIWVIDFGRLIRFIEGRDPELKQFTHKWMIYVVEPPQSKQEVSAFITGVRFHLHPSYKPHDVVDVTEAPFKLTRLGWGEFPIRVQLFFVDKKRNKTVDLIHHLKLDDSHSGKQLLGSERSIEIELDRNTDFKDTSSTPSSGQQQQQQQQQEVELPAVMAVKQKMSLLGGILKESVRKLPIVRAGEFV